MRGLWADLLSRAGRGELPRPDELGAPLTPFFLVDLAEQGFRGPYWVQLAQVLAALGAGPPAAARAAGSSRVVPHPSLVILCADYDLPVRDYSEYAAHLRRSRVIAPDMRYGTFARLRHHRVPGLAQAGQ